MECLCLPTWSGYPGEAPLYSCTQERLGCFPLQQACGPVLLAALCDFSKQIK